MVFIHDSNIFDFEYDNMIENPNPVGTDERPYGADTVPNKNFKLIENLWTIFQ